MKSDIARPDPRPFAVKVGGGRTVQGDRGKTIGIRRDGLVRASVSDRRPVAVGWRLPEGEVVVVRRIGYNVESCGLIPYKV